MRTANRTLPIVSLLLAVAAIGVIATAQDTEKTPATKPQSADIQPAGDEKPDYDKPQELCKLANEKINESSGLAVSRRKKDVFWTHNDSGDKAVIYAFDSKGKDLGAFSVIGANARDWEDMASFSVGNKHYLLLADTGDNNKNRETCELYIVHEPLLGKKAEAQKKTVQVAIKIAFAYPDGAHDCESVAIDPAGKMIYVATKANTGEAQLYSIPLLEKTPAKPVKAKAVAKLPVPYATAMDFSADGRRAIVLTYGDAMEFTRSDKQTWAEAFATKPRTISMPSRKQGESICYGLDNKTLYLTSEKTPTPLWVVPVKEKEKQ